MTKQAADIPNALYLMFATQDIDAVLAQPHFAPPSLISEGFIHACLTHQVPYVVQRFYSAVPDITLLIIDPKLVTAEIKYESASVSEYGDFPHIYGPLNTDAIIEVQQYSQDDFVV
jgi:uncharacterized protein (DUF952 family)